jgi:hypothetical protein
LIVGGGANLFADEQHGCFVTLAFADYDRAVHGNVIHHLPHGFGGGLVRLMAVAGAHGTGRGNGRLFYDAQQFETQLNLHESSRFVCVDKGLK